MTFQRYENETPEELIYRVCSAKEQVGTWQEVADILNKLLNQEYTESKYRKQYQGFCNMLKANQSKFLNDKEILDDIRNQQRELEQSKIQFRDERNAWNKQNYIMARTSQKLDYLSDTLSQIGKVEFNTNYNNSNDVKVDDNDMLICLSDLHIGASYDNVFGKYDIEIAKQRLDNYFEKIIQLQKLHQCENAYITLLGDLISGSIHKTIQITNRENVINQIKTASELIASFCDELSCYFKKIKIYSVSGNHSRIDLKSEALKDERLDDLITFILDKTLNHKPNIEVYSQKLDNTIECVEIREKAYFIVHGDYDSPTESSLMRLCTMVGIYPYAVVMGHRHTPAFSEKNGIKIIQSGNLGGSGDDYTIQKRLYGKPSQTICICNNKGIECVYPIELT